MLYKYTCTELGCSWLAVYMCIYVCIDGNKAAE